MVKRKGTDWVPWAKKLDKRKVERVAHIKLSPHDHEGPRTFRARVRTVAATREAVHRREERDVTAPGRVARYINVRIHWLPNDEGAHVLIDAKG